MYLPFYITRPRRADVPARRRVVPCHVVSCRAAPRRAGPSARRGRLRDRVRPLRERPVRRVNRIYYYVCETLTLKQLALSLYKLSLNIFTREHEWFVMWNSLINVMHWCIGYKIKHIMIFKTLPVSLPCSLNNNLYNTYTILCTL